MVEEIKISVVIVNYNGDTELKRAVASVVTEQSVAEIVIVDNASRKFPDFNQKKIKTIFLDRNLGFAGGANVGILNCSNQHVLLMNSDAYLVGDSLNIFIDQVIASGFDICQPKISDETGNYSDGCGAMLNKTYTLRHNNYLGAVSENQQFEGDVFAVKGSVIYLKRNFFIEVGGFDSDFWCYWEESDLCHRAIIMGYRVGFINIGNFRHSGAMAAKRFPSTKIHAYDFANKLTSHLKNFQARNIAPAVLWHVLMTSIFSCAAFIIRRNPRVLLGWFWSFWLVLTRLKKIMRVRKNISKARKLTDREVYEKVGVEVSLGYFISLFKGYKSR